MSVIGRLVFLVGLLTGCASTTPGTGSRAEQCLAGDSELVCVEAAEEAWEAADRSRVEHMLERGCDLQPKGYACNALKRLTDGWAPWIMDHAALTRSTSRPRLAGTSPPLTQQEQMSVYLEEHHLIPSGFSIYKFEYGFVVPGGYTASSVHVGLRDGASKAGLWCRFRMEDSVYVFAACDHRTFGDIGLLDDRITYDLAAQVYDVLADYKTEWNGMGLRWGETSACPSPARLPVVINHNPRSCIRTTTKLCVDVATGEVVWTRGNLARLRSQR